ncbi:MAG: hypothetical protein AAGC81_10110 [Pseudomonadota bacterium]
MVDNISTPQPQILSFDSNDFDNFGTRDSSNSVSFSQSTFDPDMKMSIGSELSSRFSVDMSNDMEVNYNDIMTAEPETGLRSKTSQIANMVWEGLKEIMKQIFTGGTINIARAIKANNEAKAEALQAHYDTHTPKTANADSVSGTPENALNAIDDAGWGSATEALQNLEKQGIDSGAVDDDDTGYGQIGDDYGEIFSVKPKQVNIANKDPEFASNLANNLNEEQLIADDIINQMEIDLGDDDTNKQ